MLGFFWSFINPVLLLSTYWLVFTYMLPSIRQGAIEHYFLFLFCGILPWTAFSSSVLESASILISGGNLIKKVLFPAEVLPVVTVLTNTVQLLLGLPILLAVLVAEGRLGPTALLLPLPMAVQLVLTLGLGLLVSALTVHFRDVQSILSHLLHVWFFATPVLYLMPETGTLATVLRLNPMAHVVVAYQDLLYFGGIRQPLGLAMAAAFAVALFVVGAFLFDRMRDTLVEEV